MVVPAGYGSSRTPTRSAILVAKSRALTPGDPSTDHVGDRIQPHVGAMNGGIRSLMVNYLEVKARKGNVSLFSEACSYLNRSEEFVPCLLHHWRQRKEEGKTEARASAFKPEIRKGEAAKHHGWPTSKMFSNLEWYSLIFLLFSHLKSTFSSSLGQGRGKGSTPSVGHDRRYSGQGKCLLSFVVCVVCFLQIN